MLVAHFQRLANYNTLANCRLYEACSQLPDTERKCIRPAFFKSIHGTLNHILVGDRIWLQRFGGGEIESTRLDAILYEDFDQLCTARLSEDQRIETFASGLTDELLTHTIEYRNNAGNIHSDPVDLLIAHFFNHQTHHRGQVHDMLTQTTIAPPVLDLHRLLRP